MNILSRKSIQTLFYTLALTVVSIPSIHADDADIHVDFTGFNASSGSNFSYKNNVLTAEWSSGDKVISVSFRVEYQKRGKSRHPQAPLIQSIRVTENDKTVDIFRDLQPEYAIFLGKRNLEKRDGWQIFFDYPYQQSYGVQKAVLDITGVTVSSVGTRTTISFEGLKAGEFEGALNFTIYDGSPLLHMEAALTTEQDERAYLYHVGLSNLTGEVKNMCWQNGEDEFNCHPAKGEFATPKRTRFRSIIAESDTGSLAAFPAPHRFLPPLDGIGNYGFNWSGQQYLDLFNGYGWGVRQPVVGDGKQVPWLNAKPGSLQKMGVFLFINNESAANTLEEIKKFTHADTFVDLPGYKKFTSHYHVEHALDFIAKQKVQKTTGIPEGLENPEFVQFFKKVGVDIVHLGEFHNGQTPRLLAEERLKQLHVLHQETKRLSTDDFLLLPGEEPNVHLGGHWMSFFPKPVYWVLNNKVGAPFVEQTEKYGPVYHIGSQEDVLKLFEKENGLMWAAHARIKSSTGYPDKYKDEAFYKSDRYLGAAWKNMPANMSEDNMGSRVLNLLDDMSNWGDKKYAIGEVDVFKIKHDYELYGAMNINYIKLEALPKFEDGWQPVIDSLRGGNFFVSTGEVLLKSYTVGGKESGGTLTLNDGKKAQLKTEISWTFPLSYMDVISGDGSNVYHQRIDLNDTKAFGTKEIKLDLDLKDRKWVRFEVWDVATNGAFTQPIWIKNAGHRRVGVKTFLNKSKGQQ